MKQVQMISIFVLFFLILFVSHCSNIVHFEDEAPLWGAADAEIKVPSGRNTELKRPPFKTCSRSVYSHTCYAYCQGFLLVLISTLPVHSPAFFPKPLPIFPVLAIANTWFLCRPAE